MSDTPPGPPKDLPVEGGSSKSPTSPPNASSAGGLQTMAQMIEAARKNKEKNAAPTPQPQQKQPQKKQEKKAPRKQPQQTQQAPSKKSAPTQPPKKQEQPVAAVSPVAKASSPKRGLQVAVGVLAATQLGLVALVGYLFLETRTGTVAEQKNVREQVVGLQDEVFDLQVTGKDVERQGEQLATVEETQKALTQQQEQTAYELEAQAIPDARRIADTDRDGLNDYAELVIHGTDPNTADTDGDGYEDGAEVRQNYNPTGEGRVDSYDIRQAFVVQEWNGRVRDARAQPGDQDEAVATLSFAADGAVSGALERTNQEVLELRGTYAYQLQGERISGRLFVGAELENGEEETGQPIFFYGDVDPLRGTMSLAFATTTAGGTWIQENATYLVTLQGVARGE